MVGGTAEMRSFGRDPEMWRVDAMDGDILAGRPLELR